MQLLAIRLGTGAVILPRNIERLHMHFAFKTYDGHQGPRFASCTHSLSFASSTLPQEILATHAPTPKIPQPSHPHDRQPNNRPNRPRNPLRLPKSNKPSHAARTPRPRRSILQTCHRPPRNPGTFIAVRKPAHLFPSHPQRRDLRGRRLQGQDPQAVAYTARRGGGHEAQVRR